MPTMISPVYVICEAFTAVTQGIMLVVAWHPQTHQFACLAFTPQHDRTCLLQVARQVDVLDVRLKDEQESSLKALEAILANASPTA